MASILRGRYAPSPTGPLHLGNLRTALLAWLFARAAGGGFILRMEDLDLPRMRPGAASQLLADLRWLGLEWDEGPDVGGPYGPYTQSARQAVYQAALARLRARDRVYPCYCTRAELRANRGAHPNAPGTGAATHAPHPPSGLHLPTSADATNAPPDKNHENIASAPHGLPPNAADDGAARYPGTCRALTAAERAARDASGRHPSLRFRAPDAPFTFTDRIMGPQTQNTADAGDFIVQRSDGLIAYHLAVVVDDALMGVTQIVRGADLLPFVAAQRALCLALGYPPPTEYAHAPLATDATGARLAKRDHVDAMDATAGVVALRARGVAPAAALGAIAASCGLWLAGAPATPREALAAFDPARIERAPSAIIL
jgi:glutamyl-tRNA synthetase